MKWSPGLLCCSECSWRSGRVQASHAQQTRPSWGLRTGSEACGGAPHANQQTVSQELVKLFTWVFIKISFFCCEKASLCCWSVLLSRVQLFAPPWTVARQAFLSFTVSWSLLKLMSIESVMPSNYLILCCPLLLLPSIFLSIRVFSSELALCIRWLKY